MAIYNKVRSLIDTCSQKTFVAKALIDELKLQSKEENELLSISSFVSNDKISTKYSTAEICLHLNNQSHSLNTVIVNKIAQENMKIPGLLKLIENLKEQFEIADKQINGDIIDNVHMLLGADYLHLINDGFITIGKGVALRTSSGVAPLGDISRFSLDNGEAQNKNVKKPKSVNNSDANAQIEKMYNSFTGASEKFININNNNLLVSDNLNENDNELNEHIQQL